MGFRRNLTTGEIVGQILDARRLTGKKITNVVFMGMGEPMLNYDNVMRAGEIISTGLGIALRHVTVSTAGWIEGIRRMGDERQRMKLAVSLHSAVESTRTHLMPVTKRFSLADLAEALEYYYARVKTRVTFEVVFFDGVNDTPEEVARLLKFSRRIPSKINVIPFHSIETAGRSISGPALTPSPRVDRIVQHLRDEHMTVLMRSSAGVDIDAACGQLAVKLGGTRHHGNARMEAPHTNRIPSSKLQGLV
jgi:23S rRNA (adenine2503-C2)-methyltransferase